MSLLPHRLWREGRVSCLTQRKCECELFLKPLWKLYTGCFFLYPHTEVMSTQVVSYVWRYSKVEGRLYSASYPKRTNPPAVQFLAAICVVTSRGRCSKASKLNMANPNWRYVCSLLLCQWSIRPVFFVVARSLYKCKQIKLFYFYLFFTAANAWGKSRSLWGRFKSFMPLNVSLKHKHYT